jgi:hypothetical protein
MDGISIKQRRMAILLTRKDLFFCAPDIEPPHQTSMYLCDHYASYLIDASMN